MGYHNISILKQLGVNSLAGIQSPHSLFSFCRTKTVKNSERFHFEDSSQRDSFILLGRNEVSGIRDQGSQPRDLGSGSTNFLHVFRERGSVSLTTLASLKEKKQQRKKRLRQVPRFPSKQLWPCLGVFTKLS